MWGPLGDPLSPLAPVSYKVHWTRGPRQLPGSHTACPKLRQLQLYDPPVTDISEFEFARMRWPSDAAVGSIARASCEMTWLHFV